MGGSEGAESGVVNRAGVGLEGVVGWAGGGMNRLVGRWMGVEGGVVGTGLAGGGAGWSARPARGRIGLS